MDSMENGWDSHAQFEGDLDQLWGYMDQDYSRMMTLEEFHPPTGCALRCFQYFHSFK